MSTQHTPGPWTLMEVGQNFKVCTPDAERFVTRNHYLAGAPFIAEINDDFGTDATHDVSRATGHYHPVRDRELVKANARLIAAAPELLAALQRLTSDCRPAIEYAADLEFARAAIAKATTL